MSAVQSHLLNYRIRIITKIEQFVINAIKNKCTPAHLQYLYFKIPSMHNYIVELCISNWYFLYMKQFSWSACMLLRWYCFFFWYLSVCCHFACGFFCFSSLVYKLNSTQTMSSAIMNTLRQVYVALLDFSLCFPLSWAKPEWCGKLKGLTNVSSWKWTVSVLCTEIFNTISCCCTKYLRNKCFRWCLYTWKLWWLNSRNIKSCAAANEVHALLCMGSWNYSLNKCALFCF